MKRPAGTTIISGQFVHSLKTSLGFKDRARSGDSGAFAGCVVGVGAGVAGVGPGDVGVGPGVTGVGGVTGIGGATSHTPIAPNTTRPIRDATTSTDRD
ncbi:MAG: hypothetical protein WAV78_30880, partial [Xanthobacteraceae bacterium]